MNLKRQKESTQLGSSAGERSLSLSLYIFFSICQLIRPASYLSRFIMPEAQKKEEEEEEGRQSDPLQRLRLQWVFIENIALGPCQTGGGGSW